MEKRPLSALGKAALLVAAAVGLWLWIDGLLDAHRGLTEPTLRTSFNRRFANQPTLGAALDVFRGRWPPGYPALLFATKQLGLPLRAVHPALFVLSCGALYLAARLRTGAVRSAWPVLLYAASAFHAFNLLQLTGEALVVPLALIAYWLAVRYARSGSVGALSGLAATAAALGLVRTFALLWVLAAASLAILLAPHAPIRRRIAHGLAFGAVAVLPAVAWMAHVHERTGFTTGMDRGSWETRVLPPHLEHWRTSTDFGGNVTLAGRTLFVDFLSPSRAASHEVVDHPLELDGGEKLAGALGGACLLALVVARASLRRPRREPPGPGARSSSGSGSPELVALLFLGSYLALLVGLWSVSNNDPVYSRFLYPVYPFAILCAAFAHAALADGDSRAWARLPARALFLVVLATQLVKGASPPADHSPPPASSPSAPR